MPDLVTVERALGVVTAVGLVLSTTFAGAAFGVGGPQETGDSDEAGWTARYAPTLDGDVAPPGADGTVRIDGEAYDDLSTALEAAEAGDVLEVEGRLDGPVTVRTPGVTIAGPAGGPGPTDAVLAGDAEGTVLTVAAPNVTVRDLWVRNAGTRASENDAAVWIAADGVTVRNVRVTETTFGIWLDGVAGARVLNNTVVGREGDRPLTERGNGIQIWHSTDTLLANNRITGVRDGLYYSWSSEVVARNNTLWDLRYGVHYMYSDHCRLVDNRAVGNDVGYALMVSEQLTLDGNVALGNRGQSGHGLLFKSIDDTRVTDNHFVGNENGLFVYNSLRNVFKRNLIAHNEVGVHLTAGSVEETVANNSFVGNDRHALAVLGTAVTWNETVGNYWSGERVTDLDGDGVGETTVRPAGRTAKLAARRPATRLFSNSPAVAAVRRAERTVPVLAGNGIVDRRPLTDPHTDDWRDYDARM